MEILSQFLKVGDVLNICEIPHTIKKVETVFHRRPDTRIRFTFENSETILFLEPDIPVNRIPQERTI